MPGRCRVWFALRSGDAAADAGRRELRREERELSRELAARFRPEAGGSSSLSHSFGSAALGICGPGARIGVDLECVRPRDTLALANLTYSSHETAWLAGLADCERLGRFYDLWTIKEAFAKASGMDLLLALSRCRVTRTATAWHADVPSNLRCAVTVFEPSPQYRLAVVRLTPDAENPALLEPEFIARPDLLDPRCRIRGETVAFPAVPP